MLNLIWEQVKQQFRDVQQRNRISAALENKNPELLQRDDVVRLLIARLEQPHQQRATNRTLFSAPYPDSSLQLLRSLYSCTNKQQLMEAVRREDKNPFLSTILNRSSDDNAVSFEQLRQAIFTDYNSHQPQAKL